MAERQHERNAALFYDVMRGDMTLPEVGLKYGITKGRVLQIAKDEGMRRGLITAEESLVSWGVMWLRKRYHEQNRELCKC